MAFAALLTAVASQVSFPLPFTPVPVTLQPTVVLLIGAALGARAAAASQTGYLAAGVMGLPVFALAPALVPGLARLAGPTGGYLLSYPVAAFVVGTMVDRGWGRSYTRSVVTLAVGMAIVLAGGLAGLLVYMPGGVTPATFSIAFQAGVLPFVGIDLVKIAVAAAIVPFLAGWRQR